MSPSVNIIKWWWENAGLPKDNAEVLSAWSWKKAIIVSAMRSNEFNTTSKLLEISELLSVQVEWFDMKIERIVTELEDFHLQLLSQQWANSSIITVCKWIFIELRNIISSYLKDIPNDKKITPGESNDFSINYKRNNQEKTISLAGFWEYISARLNTLYMQTDTSLNVWLLEKLPWEEKPFYENIKRVSTQVWWMLKSKDIVFIPWYLWGTGQNVFETIWRWYTDAVAALVAISMKESWWNTKLCIEKMVEWFLSADPRIIKNPQLIEELNYLIAKEIITEKWPEAKLLHPKTLDRRVQSADIPVHLYNPFSDSNGTIISKTADKMPEGVFYIGGVKNIEALIFSSAKMEEWFIADTNSAIAKAGINVKEILGSGTEHTSLFSGGSWNISYLQKIMMEKYSLTAQDAWEFVEHRDNLSLVYCVGNMKDIIGNLAQVTACLKTHNINVKWFTQWLEQRAMAIVVSNSDYEKCINALHDELIK